MPPRLALFLGYGLIFWLFRMDMQQRRLTSPALWVPILWLAVLSSKPVAFWCSCIGIYSGGSSNLDGNPIDLLVFLGLIVAALVILWRRGFNWPTFISSNILLIVLYLYLASTSMWSEHSFPTIKRIFKDFGSVAVALVILTEGEPLRAARIMFVRLAYVLFPLSIVFIKYYPSIGRITGRTGDSMFSGVAWHKSSLGEVVFLFSLFIVLDLMEMHRDGEGGNRKRAIWIRFSLLIMGVWLVYTCGSVTALLCFVLGCLIIWGSGRLLRLANPALMVFRCAVVLLCAYSAEKTFGISGAVLEALGKNKTLTGRTEIWDMVKEANTQPLLGNGYISFWTSRSAEPIQQFFNGVMNSAHNGFLDMYLDGGLIGVGLLILLMLRWGIRSLKRMLAGTLFGRVAFMIWFLAIFFNYSETALFRLLPIWFTLLIFTLDCPLPVHHDQFYGEGPGTRTGQEDEMESPAASILPAGHPAEPEQSFR